LADPVRGVADIEDDFIPDAVRRFAEAPMPHERFDLHSP